MLQRRLFTKTRKEAPKDEVSKNAELLIRGGFIHKEMAGVYSFLPLGLRVIKKIEEIIREEMNAIGGTEMRTAVLQNKEIWEKSGRWDDAVVDNWFKTSLKNGGEIGLSFTNEEAYSNLLTQYISSYKDLPVYPYDFKNIFRNETRSKSGILRGREFYWKALYSFSRDDAEHEEFYEKAKQAYKNIFNRAGIGEYTYLTRASGGSFSEFSHEFQTVTEAGEDTIYITDEEKKEAINKEIAKGNEGREAQAIEVGNIFSLGTKFSEPFGLAYNDADSKKKLVVMGSYGIGLGRLMGTIVEVLSDERGIVWPREVAPFRVHLILVSEDKKIRALADELYKTLTSRGIETLYDDRDVRAGEKFADSDLIGIPSRIIVGNKTIESKLYELKDRESGEMREVSLEHLIEELKS
ncbi:MAG: aminoacyl--tRNA ligase-related protein [Patescibacteria group bacterium]|mgnify:CR=1 FL=1